jgi:outer membrane protein assembly factor BamD (BamD/ComL family)
MEFLMKLSGLFISLIIVVFGVLGGCSQKDKDKVDLNSEEGLFASAARSELANKFQEAVDTYQSILKKYPTSPRLDKALFMIGFIKAEHLNQKDEALGYFNQVVAKYPESDLIDDSQFMIESIESGKDALSKFEEKTQE